jgi:cell division protein FtsI (penicillin-binding protein 3)
MSEPAESPRASRLRAGAAEIGDEGQSHFVPHPLRVEGSRKIAASQVRARVGLAMLAACLVYGVIVVRLAQFGFTAPGSAISQLQDKSILARRPNLVDRNGVILATDINTASLYAEPRRIVEVDETIEQLSEILPDLDTKETWNRLKSNAGFVWLKRELTPTQQTRILALGLPGIGFRPETRRFYPKGETAAHIIGHVNIDNDGIAGIEKRIDDQGLRALRRAGMTAGKELEPVNLSIDIRIQHFLRDELAKGIDRFHAIAAAGVILDVDTGEVVAMVSLPDYDPNRPVDALQPDRLNRVTGGAYEMGSTFKTFTTAMALDSGKVRISDSFDASQPLRIAGYTIQDFHGKNRVLTVPEIYIYSSNIGTARMADAVGIEGHREFLHRMGMLDRLDFDLPEIAVPSEPSQWKKIHSVTISFGHGATTTVMQTAAAAAALVNGGRLIPPTLFPRNEEEAAKVARQVVQASTSEAMRQLMRLNVTNGSGRRAEVPGYRVGGKTGTAEKVIDGRYSSDSRFNAFLAAFPVDAPRYVVLVTLDEPKPEKEGMGATAAVNTAVVVGEVIRRSAPLLGVAPMFDDLPSTLLISH